MPNLKIISLVAIFATGLFAVNNPGYFTKANTKKSLSKSYNNLNDEEQDSFMLGRSFFTIPWIEAPSTTTARDGLGPLFNANTCINCHQNNSLGSVYNKDGKISRSLVARLSILPNNSKEHKNYLQKAGFIPEPTYGAQISINGTRRIPYEAKLHIDYEDKEVVYADGKKVTLRKPNYSLTDLNYGPLSNDASISVRKAPALVGLGLLEDLSDSSILANVDEDDKNNDGISGRANLVYSIETGTYKLGRYTYKASAPSVKHQIAGAFVNDMGLTTTLFPNENCTSAQEKCLNAPKSRDAIDVPDMRLDAVTFYLTHLKVPKSKNVIPEGKELFNQIGCTSCHVSSFTTKKGIKINPYSDFLLHDMGEALSDGRSEFRASANEWKTAPLWGINSYEKTLRKQPDYLHDGRARNLEEAILWHGGEAQASRESFMSLDENKREMIIKFIGTL